MRRNGKHPLSADEVVAGALKKAKGAVAQAVLENRGALEVAISALTRAEFDETCADLGEIIDALDRWHRASMVVMEHTRKPIVPPGFEVGGEVN